MAGKVIICCAITGAIHTPSMSDALPITPEQIARSAIDAAAAGAAILHLHARNPETGEPTPDPAVYMRFLPVIKQSCDAVINITTGGGLNMTLEERLAAPLQASPEMSSLNMGSMNFNISRAGRPRRRVEARLGEALSRAHGRPHLPQHVPRHRGIIERLGAATARGSSSNATMSATSTISPIASTARLVEPPLFVQTIFGILGGIGAEPRNLMFMRETADRLFGGDYVWSVLAAGRHQMAFTTMAGILGGNVRVGLEDSLYIGKGKLATSNAEQVAKIRRILEELSLEIASPAEARAMLHLKGGDRVGF